MPADLPPWPAVSQQNRRWIEAGVVAMIIADRRELIRLGEGRAPQPTAVILDSRTPESGHRAGWDGTKRHTGTKVYRAVDTLGQRLALHVTPAHDQDRAQVADLAEAVPAATGGNRGAGLCGSGLHRARAEVCRRRAWQPVGGCHAAPG